MTTSKTASKTITKTATKTLATDRTRTYNKRPKKDSRGGPMAAQISFMRNPDAGHGFEVGDTVEVYCYHEKSS